MTLGLICLWKVTWGGVHNLVIIWKFCEIFLLQAYWKPMKVCRCENRLFLEKNYKNMISENFQTRFLENKLTNLIQSSVLESGDHALYVETKIRRKIQNFKILKSDWSKNFEFFSWNLFSKIFKKKRFLSCISLKMHGLRDLKNLNHPKRNTIKFFSLRSRMYI